jgi:hypothetical protein
LGSSSSIFFSKDELSVYELDVRGIIAAFKAIGVLEGDENKKELLLLLVLVLVLLSSV